MMADHAAFEQDLAEYVLGTLDVSRAAEVRDHLESCAACRRELDALRTDAAHYALSAVGPQPPSRARDRLLHAIEAEPRMELERRSRRLAWLPGLVMASLAALALVFGAESVVLHRLVHSLERDNSKLEASLQKQQALWAALNSPDAVHMTLASAHKPMPEGRVIYVPKRGTVVFFANYFAPAPDKKVYQLWLMPANGHEPMPCGTFKPGESGMASFTMEGMPENVPAKDFAVTLEPDGGSQKPTMPILMSATSAIPTE